MLVQESARFLTILIQGEISVLRNLPLVSRLVGVDTILIRHTKPGREDLVIQLTVLGLLTVVGHEAVDESVRGGLHEDTCERSEEVVSVRRKVSNPLRQVIDGQLRTDCWQSGRHFASCGNQSSLGG